MQMAGMLFMDGQLKTSMKIMADWQQKDRRAPLFLAGGAQTVLQYFHVHCADFGIGLVAAGTAALPTIDQQETTTL